MWWQAATRIPWIGKLMFLISGLLRDLHAASMLVADELDYNAEVVGLFHGGNSHISSVQEQLRLDAWKDHRATLAALERRHPEIWRDVSAAYADLQRTETRGAVPPQGAALTDLAERLRGARY